MKSTQKNYAVSTSSCGGPPFDCFFIAPRIPPGRLKGLAALFKRSHIDSDIALLGAWSIHFCQLQGRYQRNMY